MTVEKDPIVARELENAWQTGKDQACYALLSLIPDGVVFKVGELLLECSPSIFEEEELMGLSIKRRKEFGLIKTVEEKVILEGSEGGIELDDIAGALYRVAHPKKPALFSHMHWDIEKHPLPGHAGIGFGDIPIFDMLIAQIPLLECRVAFNSGSGVRSIIYRGQVES